MLTDKCYKLDVANINLGWVQIASMKTVRGAFAMEHYNQNVFVFGGDKLGGGERVSEIEEYNHVVCTYMLNRLYQLKTQKQSKRGVAGK